MKKVLALLLILCVLESRAQSQYDIILNTIEENSLMLSALKEEMEADKLVNSTGIFLANPEVEFNYLWGSPVGIENGAEFSVSQSFDFPSVYVYRGQVEDLKNTNTELVYKSERINLLLMAKEICINLTFYNALAREYALRLENAKNIAKSHQRMAEEGSVTALEVNKAQLNLTEMQNKVAEIKMEQEGLLLELKRLNGGVNIGFQASSFFHAPLASDFEAWYAEVELRSPVLQYVKGQIQINEKQVRLNRALGLPKFSAGYKGEYTLGERMQGISIGMSIPLWENKNSIKQAKAQVKASQTVADNTRMQFYTNLKRLFLKASTLQESVSKYRNSVENHNNAPLLKIALDSGEISLLDYLLEKQFYFQTVEKMLVLERDLGLAIAQLSAVEL